MTADFDKSAEEFRRVFDGLRAEISRVIVGQDAVVENALVGLFTSGHILLEGVPGLGKTMLVNTLSDALSLRFSRIQFTPDLMPADIIGTNMVVEDAEGHKYFEFERGPIFANVVLADEINRATPKTQSALLEAMQEHNVTVGGTQHRLDPPFFVLATQNPIEMEGTYPLPEAQLDRFMFKLKVGFPSMSESMEIMDRTTRREIPTAQAVMDGEEVQRFTLTVREVPIASHVQEFALRVLYATHPESEAAIEETKRFVKYGASPRGAQAMILAGKVLALLDGRFNVSIDDIRRAALPSLRHRIILSFEGEAEGIDPDTIIDTIVKQAAP